MTWFDPWCKRLIDRIRRYDWPEPESEWWMDLLGKLAGTRCDETEAIAAIGAIYPGPAHLGEIPGALTSAIEAARTDRTRTRGEAEAVSKGCPECYGDGATIRHVRLERTGEVVRLAMICHRCAAGQWLRDWWRAHEQRTGQRGPIRDLRDWPCYQSDPLRPVPGATLGEPPPHPRDMARDVTQPTPARP